MSLIMVFIAIVSVVLAACALFLAAAVSSVVGARRRYEGGLAIPKPLTLRPLGSDNRRSPRTHGLEISMRAEFADWRFPDRQRFGPGQGLPLGAGHSNGTNSSPASTNSTHGGPTRAEWMPFRQVVAETRSKEELA
jgi:hypothetical protein